MQERAYEGYAFTVHLRTDVADGTQAQLERLDGAAWVPVGPTAGVFEGRASADAELPLGTHQLRFTTERDGQSGVSAPVTVEVVKAAGWTTSKRDNGRYRSGDSGPRFRVTKKGRQIRGFTATLSAFCVGPTPSDNRVIPSIAKVPRARVAPDGRVLEKVRISETDVVLRGRLRKRRFKSGVVELQYETCTGYLEFSARRRR